MSEGSEEEKRREQHSLSALGRPVTVLCTKKERPENKEFQGSWSKQIGVIFWFGFSTLVYAHREKLKHNLSRFVVTVWVFAVLILTTSYTATLTSMMTVQQIRFNFNKNHVGHLFGSPVAMAAFSSPGNHVASMKGLSSSEEYAKFLLNKTVTFVVHELPYLKVLLGENPAKFFMVKTKCTTSGFGFRNLEARAKGRLNEIAKRWLEIPLPYTADDTSNPITLDRFRGVFMITGVSSAFALGVLLIHWPRDRWECHVNSLSWFYPVNWFNIFLSQRLVHLRVLRTIHPSPLDDPISENAVQMVQSNIRSILNTSAHVLVHESIA
uniref:Ionotropic glutamate receptor C-terminal domain-containing protein n=1 Tax=Brassica oleracea var. oleracea TaxID=109376 RepID=A0A0D3AWV4_BRAOL